MDRLFTCFSLALGLVLAGTAAAQEATPPTPVPAAPAAIPPTDPGYRLTPGDSVSVAIFGQPSLGTAAQISYLGVVRLPYLEEVTLAGKTVLEAEKYLEQLYREKQLLKKPLVTITVSGYANRVVFLLGAFRSPGQISFPPQATSLDIVDLVSYAGGFQPIANTSAVKLTHRGADGKETSQIVDVGKMISGRENGHSQQHVIVYPGDHLFAPEKLF